MSTKAESAIPRPFQDARVILTQVILGIDEEEAKELIKPVPFGRRSKNGRRGPGRYSIAHELEISEAEKPPKWEQNHVNGGGVWYHGRWIPWNGIKNGHTRRGEIVYIQHKPRLLTATQTGLIAIGELAADQCEGRFSPKEKKRRVWK